MLRTMSMTFDAPAREHHAPDVAILRPRARDYALVGALLMCTGAAIAVALYDVVPVASTALRAPMAGMLLLTAAVWLGMASIRNIAILLQKTDAAYYVDYQTRPPADWIERPARTFNNLMQLPMLFYVACLVMMQAPEVDSGQIGLAWLFVGLRALHAVAYIFWNQLASRFGSYVSSTVALAALLIRVFAM
jgi:hypothetical protein